MKWLIQDFKKQLEAPSSLDYIWVKRSLDKIKGMSRKVGQATKKTKTKTKTKIENKPKRYSMQS